MIPSLLRQVAPPYVRRVPGIGLKRDPARTQREERREREVGKEPRVRAHRYASSARNTSWRQSGIAMSPPCVGGQCETPEKQEGRIPTAVRGEGRIPTAVRGDAGQQR